MPRALILGGTGVIGRATAIRLLEAGWMVDVTGRDPRKFNVDVVNLGGNYVASDRKDPIQLRSVFDSGADVLVDCLCYSADDAQQLIPYARDSSSTVMISSKGVYADANGNHSNSADSPRFPVPILESQSTVAPGNGDYTSREGYGPNKVAAEHILLDSGLPVSVIRPSKVHGVGSVRPREWYFAKRALDRREHLLVRNNGKNVDHPTAAVNLAALIEVVARAPGQRILNSADPDAPSVRDISRAIASSLSHVFTEVSVESDAPRSLGQSPWDCAYPIILDTSASLDLGYVPVGTYAETIRDEMTWLTSIAIGGDDYVLPDWFDIEFFKQAFEYEIEDEFLAVKMRRINQGY